MNVMIILKSEFKLNTSIAIEFLSAFFHWRPQENLWNKIKEDVMLNAWFELQLMDTEESAELPIG